MKFLFVLAAMMLSVSHQASAGGGGIGFDCSVVGRELIASKTVSSIDNRLVLRVEMFSQLDSCVNGMRKTVWIEPGIIWAQDNKVPNGGYIDGRYTMRDRKGDIVAERFYDRSFFVVVGYPFPDSTTSVDITIGGFEPFVIQRIR
jgi:hypothetical protein